VKSNKIIISIIVPCRNEERYIENCIKSIQAFKLPNNSEIEVLVIDGNSTDNTRKIIKKLMEIDSKILLINNPNIFQSFAMNIGINKAKGDWIMRLDAHTIYGKNYLLDLYKIAIEVKSDNCGGQIITNPGADNYGASLVQAISTHPFGVGNSGFRTELDQGDVDTVPFGFFKKSLFNKIGLFDERLIRAQDYEFNRRIIKSGGKVWMVPSIKTQYYNQPSLLAFYKKQIFKEAPYNVFMWYLAPYTFAYRHAVTGVFCLGFIGGIILAPFSSLIKYIFCSVLILYALLAVFSSIQQAMRYQKLFHIITLPLCFFLFHFLHGMGILIGLFSLFIRSANIQKINRPWKGYKYYRVKTQNIL
jgi:glycosyltransferase involved in cell wall biosynthesis